MDKDFIFPNSILVVLSDKCSYNNGYLTIPEIYKSFAVIDGQHRLFSYANTSVHDRLGNDCRIMVTAIQFIDSTADQVMRYSARTFVEINMNQTSIKKDHLYAIAYDILGETYPDALAAKVLLAVNTMSGKAKGLFDTNQTGLGIIQTKTVITALRVITNLESVKALSKPTKSLKRQQRRQGFINLFGVATIDDLLDHTVFVRKTANCLNQFFSNVEAVFEHGWPSRDNENRSSFAYAKMIAGLVKLLDQFISEGLTWKDIASELAKIKTNVMELRKIPDYQDVLFLTGHEDIPDSRPSYNETFDFLNANRSKKTSIQKVLLKE